MASKPQFKLAMDAFELALFIPNHALTLVSLWGALEGLFLESKAELRFRLSISIAGYLEPRGESRIEMQKRIAKLYDKRSAAAHGQPKHTLEDLCATFDVMRRVLCAMIESCEVPTQDDLTQILLGKAS